MEFEILVSSLTISEMNLYTFSPGGNFVAPGEGEKCPPDPYSEINTALKDSTDIAFWT